jgi:hypothetical protein
MFSNSESHEAETVQCRFFASTLLKNTIYRNKEINCNHVSGEHDTPIQLLFLVIDKG